ncbi:MAG: PadR family transcriptional regulator [Candidatus Micrarchaeota archaeon]|nr:PadR family transcriptional regulator [Candidatus Micrarchaeota archaeon]MDE1834477.1 PadR family transcriptional regulator [Candidatus Micrarchaeota archaeon]MDE1859272.1 PadR family transcriptional regulator [Candidatus Micrarchaeota archaeon]
MAKEFNDVYLDKGVKKGILKIMILSHIYNNKTYPYALLKTMRATAIIHGHDAFKGITKNDMYNLTSSLEKDGFLKSKTQLKGNKVQKVFTITGRGRDVVKNKERVIKDMIKELTRLVKEQGFDEKG